MLKDKGDNIKNLNEECENDSESEKKDNEKGNGNVEENTEEVVEEEKEEEEDKEISLVEELKKENSKLKSENEKSINEVNAIKDKLVGIMAEYDNFRKRTAKEKDNIYFDACKDILKEVLPVLDNLEGQ